MLDPRAAILPATARAFFSSATSVQRRATSDAKLIGLGTRAPEYLGQQRTAGIERVTLHDGVRCLQQKFDFGNRAVHVVPLVGGPCGQSLFFCPTEAIRRLPNLSEGVATVTPQALFYESLSDALRAIVAAAGGTKAVAVQLWPEKSPDAAHRTLLDALNEARPEKLSPEQVLWMLALGRRIRCHAGMNYLAREAGYADPTPIEPEDERARLQREYIEAVKGMARLADRLERIGVVGDGA